MTTSDNQKQRRAERAREFEAMLIARYPDCFSRQKAAVRPLAVGIQEQLRDALARATDIETPPNWIIKQALARYTRSPAYLDAIIAGHHRVDLEGRDAGAVTEAAQANARLRRDEQKQRAAERRHSARQKHKRAGRKQRATVQQDKLDQLAQRFNDA